MKLTKCQQVPKKWINEVISDEINNDFSGLIPLENGICCKRKKSAGKFFALLYYIHYLSIFLKGFLTKYISTLKTTSHISISDFKVSDIPDFLIFPQELKTDSVINMNEFMNNENMFIYLICGKLTDSYHHILRKSEKKLLKNNYKEEIEKYNIIILTNWFSTATADVC